MSFDPFKSTFDLAAVKAHQQREVEKRQAQAQDLARALGGPIQRAALEQLIAEEEARPSFLPGDVFEDTAWREGRKAMLRDLLRQITPTETT